MAVVVLAMIKTPRDGDLDDDGVGGLLCRQIATNVQSAVAVNAMLGTIIGSCTHWCVVTGLTHAVTTRCFADQTVPPSAPTSLKQEPQRPGVAPSCRSGPWWRERFGGRQVGCYTPKTKVHGLVVLAVKMISADEM